MRTGLRLEPRSVVALLCSASAACATTAALAAPAGAWQHKGAPEYSLSVVEGASTQPEYSIDGVSGRVESEDSEAEVAVSIIHNGLIVDKQSNKGSVWLSQVPQVGDTLTYESTTGFKTQVVYDGLPTMEPTVCAGSTNFSGQRTLGYTIEGGYYTVVPPVLLRQAQWWSGAGAGAQRIELWR
jgi:hypothetical protein